MPSLSHTALLVIDVQESFRQRAEEWADTANPAVIDNVSSLVDHARAEGDPVIWITHSEPGSGGVFDPDNGFIRVVDDLRPDDAELQLTKTTVSAFLSTDLEDHLNAAGIDTLVVCGIRTEQCCETTTRMAADLGFTVHFVTDATTTSAISATDSYAAVSGEDLMRRTESILAARGFASILTTAQRISAVSQEQ